MKKLFPLMFVWILFLQACGEGTPVPQAVEVPTEIAAAVSIETLTAEPIVHTVIPQGGIKARAYAHDNENLATFENKNVTVGDEFLKNRFERPFTSNDMTYLPDLDIVDFGIASDDQFFYISIIFAGRDVATDSMTGIYGVEIDRDADGRAELLLATRPPYSSEFTAENVVVMADLDGDIGGPTINRPDPDFAGDGYNGIIFDLSQNIHPDDPDLIWVRFVDGEKPTIEIAYRKWIFRGGDEKFMWSVFAYNGLAGLDPGKFNVHDTISEVEAGSPFKGDPHYPIKALAAMDNTCRVPLGFAAVGTEPLGCQVKGPERVVKDDVEGGNAVFCSQFAEICNRNIPGQLPPQLIIRPFNPAAPSDGTSNTIIIGG
jgi:hypothetical protein